MRRKRSASAPMLCSFDLEQRVRPAYPTCPRRPRGAARLLLLITVTMAASLACWSPGAARAEDAQVLPKGVSRVTLDDLIYLPVTKRWNPHGNPEDLAGDFNHRRLDSSVFSILPAGLNIGVAEVEYEYRYNILDLGFQHGLTDQLTLGIDIPYYWADNLVKAQLNTSGANLGLHPSGTGFAPISLGGVPLTTGDVQRLLGPGLAGVAGFGFKPIKNFSAEGLGDITAGAKYQFFAEPNARWAGTFGVRFPTGRQDDPDDLSDIAWSSGAWALLFRLHGDYLLSSLWGSRPPANAAESQAGDVSLGATLRFDWVLPDETTMRIPSNVTNPITTNRESVNRNLGDRYELEVSGKLQLIRDFSLSVLYRYSWKDLDDISGTRGFAYHLLEHHTDSTEHIYIVQLSYSTVPLYTAKRFPIPMGVSVAYRDRFNGSGPHAASSPSQILKTQYILFGVQVYF